MYMTKNELDLHLTSSIRVWIIALTMREREKRENFYISERKLCRNLGDIELGKIYYIRIKDVYEL